MNTTRKIRPAHLFKAFTLSMIDSAVNKRQKLFFGMPNSANKLPKLKFQNLDWHEMKYKCVKDKHSAEATDASKLKKMQTDC